MATVASNGDVGFTGRRLLVFLGIASVVVAALAPLSVRIYFLPIYAPYLPFAVVAMLMLAIWLLCPGRSARRIEETAFLVAPILSMIFSLLNPNPSDAFGSSLAGVYAAGLFVLVRYGLRIGAIKRLDFLRWATIAFVALAAVALAQIVLQTNVGVVSAYFGQNLSGGSYADESRIRVSGTFGNANVFAQVFAIYGGVIISALLFLYRRVLAALVFSVMLTAIVVSTLSRSGFLFAVAMQSAIYIYWLMRETRITAVGLVAGLGGVLITVLIFAGLLYYSDSQIAGLSRLADTGDGGRLVMIQGALRLLSDPLVAVIGVGSGQFFPAISAHDILMPYKEWRNLSDIDSSVHNWTLQVATENGLLVLLLYVYAVVMSVMRGWSVRRLEGGWMPASIAIIVSLLYLIPLQFTTSGVTPWILTPVAIALAWIQNEYDESKKQYRS